MKLIYRLVILVAVSLLLLVNPKAAPSPEPRPGRPIVLQNGTEAVIKNGKLMLLTPDGRESPAPVGHYTTREGRTLTVDANGHVSFDPLTQTNTGRAAAQMPPTPSQSRSESAFPAPNRTAAQGAQATPAQPNLSRQIGNPSIQQADPSSASRSMRSAENSGQNLQATVTEIDLLKAEVAALKSQCMSEGAKIDDLKKQMIADTQATKFTTTLLTTGLNKVGDDLKALGADYKSHVHTYTVGSGTMGAAAFISAAQSIPEGASGFSVLVDASNKFSAGPHQTSAPVASGNQ